MQSDLTKLARPAAAAMVVYAALLEDARLQGTVAASRLASIVYLGLWSHAAAGMQRCILDTWLPAWGPEGRTSQGTYQS